MKNFRIVNLTFIVFSLLHIAPAQELLTLDQAVNLALQKNRQIRVFRNTAQISKNNAHIGNAGFLPQINLNSSVNYSDAITQSRFGIFKQKATISSAQMEASFNLFNGLGSYYSFRKLQTLSQSEKLSARNNIEIIIVNVVRAYYALTAAADSRKIAGEGLRISQERLKRALKKAAYGQANKLDILSAEVDLNTDSVSYMNAVLQLKQARQNLTVLLGLEPGSAFSVQNQAPLISMPAEKELLGSALNRNAAYLLTRKELESARYAFKQSRAAYWPRLDLHGAYGYNQYAPNLAVQWDEPQRNISAGLSFSLNLFDGFKRSIQTQNAKISINNRRLLWEQTRLNLEKDVSNAYSDYQNKRALLNMNQKNLQSAQLNFKRSREIFELGHLTNTQFREAQLNLLRTKYSLSQAKYQAKIAEIRLLQLSGQLLKQKPKDSAVGTN